MRPKKLAFYGFLIWIFFSCLFCSSWAQLKTTYVEDFCGDYAGKTMWLSGDHTGILKSYPMKFDSGECTITLKPEPRHSVVLSIYRFNLGYGDQLTITDSDKFQVALIGEGDFPDERKAFVSEGPMVIHYVWNNTELVGRRFKFQFVFTQVYDGPCRYDEFECRNKKCISKDLVCDRDRHNHCGDNSDQENCGPKAEYPPTTKISVRNSSSVWIISIIVCSVILAIVIIAFIALVIRSNIRRKKLLESKKSSPTVAASIPQNASPPTVAASIPQNASPPTVAASVPQNASASPEGHAPTSIFGRLRQSIRSIKATPTAPPAELSTDNYEVPSMYPQIPSTPQLSGVDNPEFKGDDAA